MISLSLFPLSERNELNAPQLRFTCDYDELERTSA